MVGIQFDGMSCPWQSYMAISFLFRAVLQRMGISLESQLDFMYAPPFSVS